LLADYVVQLLSRQQLSNIHYREGGQDVPVPAGAIYGPKAMLINELAGSGGDAMPWYFRKMKLGPTVGKRTWGGLIASFGAPTLMDGGGHTAPDAAIYGLERRMGSRECGSARRHRSRIRPGGVGGRAAIRSLERAVEYLLDELKKNPPSAIQTPGVSELFQKRSACVCRSRRSPVNACSPAFRRNGWVFLARREASNRRLPLKSDTPLFRLKAGLRTFLRTFWEGTMRKAFLSLSLLFIAAAMMISDNRSSAQERPLLVRKPTMNRTHIVFQYAGDLWSVPRAGGEAIRLTNGAGGEGNAIFSPDGQTVAFTGEYDGNTDIFTVPATGGVPKRVTSYPGIDALCNWTPDGKSLLFLSERSSESRRFMKLFTVPVAGGLPTEVPLPTGHEGSFSPDGKQLAYEPLPRGFNAWKRYRGGMASYIWIAALADSSTEKIPREDSNDFNAMWPSYGNAEKVYFLSDRDGAITLFAYDTKTKRVSKLINNTGLDIKSATAATTGDAIVYEQFGSLNIFDLKTNRSTKVNVTINADQLAVRPKHERVGQRINGAAISPTGARAVFEARGEILSVPAEKGDARNLTGTTNVAERDPSWSPDGKWIAYFSDESGEYELHLRDQKAVGEVKKIKLEPTFYYNAAMVARLARKSLSATNAETCGLWTSRKAQNQNRSKWISRSPTRAILTPTGRPTANGLRTRR
jgi:Tol biopolymer transport system component